MLLTCPSCNSKYLVNSADLNQNGREVKCGKCEYEWFQDKQIDEKLTLSNNADSSKKFNKDYFKDDFSNKNLPSTYVAETKPRAINSIIFLFLIILIILSFWKFNEYGLTVISFINYYIYEFIFNIKLIINDLASIIYKLTN